MERANGRAIRSSLVVRCRTRMLTESSESTTSRSLTKSTVDCEEYGYAALIESSLQQGL
jgi:hypothetical protein